MTIDGVKDVHDSRRPDSAGGPTFEKILSNIKSVKDILRVGIRVNIDRENYKMNDELISALVDAEISDSVSVYLGWVEPSNGCYDPSRCLSLREFSDEKLKFAKKLVENGFNYNWLQDYPMLVSNTCCADQCNANVIAPDGTLYSCWGDIGIDELNMGSLVNANKTGNQKRYHEYMLYNPLEDAKCSECKVLPICMGGCPKRRIEGYVDRCSEMSQNLTQFLKHTADLSPKKTQPSAG